jgi:hypothetical protein
LVIVAVVAAGAAALPLALPHIGRRAFVSTALLEVRPAGPAPFEGAGPQQIEALLADQAAVLRSAELVATAMEDEQWHSLRPGKGDDAQRQFAANLHVSIGQPGHILELSFADREPKVAMVGLNAVVSAYTRLAKERGRQASAAGMTVLRELEAELEHESAQLQRAIKDITAKHGGDPALLVDSQLKRVEQVDEAILQTELVHARTGSKHQTEQFEAQKARLRVLLHRERSRLAELSAAAAETGRLRSELVAARRRQSEVQHRLDELRFSHPQSEPLEIKVLSPGSLPPKREWITW